MTLIFLTIAVVVFALCLAFGGRGSEEPWQPGEGEEWFCTHSGYSKDEILEHGCIHRGPCPMDIRVKEDHERRI